GAGAPLPARAFADASRLTARHATPARLPRWGPRHGRGRSSIREAFYGFHRRFTGFAVIKLTFNQAIEAADLARAADRDQLHFARVAGLETNRGAGGDIEAHAV